MSVHAAPPVPVLPEAETIPESSFRWTPAATETLDSRSLGHLSILTKIASGTSVAIGSMALAGWQLDLPVLRSGLGGAASVTPVTALCCLLTGLALGLLTDGPGSAGKWRRRLARVSAALLAAAGAATLVELAAKEMARPGRLAGASAAGFLLLGIALLSSGARRGGVQAWAHPFAAATTLLGAIATLGYLYDVTSLHDAPAYSTMALPAALVLLLGGLGALAARPQMGFMAVLTSASAGGAMARRVLPLSLTLPFVLGWLRWDLALTAATHTTLFASLVWFAARSLNRSDGERRSSTRVAQRTAADLARVNERLRGEVSSRMAAEKRLERSRAQLEAAQELARTGSWELDLTTRRASWSRPLYRLFGLDPDWPAPAFERFLDWVHPDDRRLVAEMVAQLERRSVPPPFHFRTVSQGGQVRHFNASCEVREDPTTQGWVATGTFSDITPLAERLELEAELRKIVTATPAVIYSYRLRPDGSNCCPYVSPSIVEIFGVPPEHLIADASVLLTLIHPEDRDRVNRTVAESARTLEPWRAEYRVRHPEKGELWIEGESTPFREPDGSTVWYGALHDITAYKHAAESLQGALREVNELKVALDEHAIVAITDPRGKITYVNDKFCQISKYSREELLGQDHRIINSGHHPKEFFRDLWATIGHGRPWHGQIKNRAKDRSYYWVDTTILPFLDDQGKPRQYIAIRADITEQKLAEEALLRRTEQLVRSNAALEQFAYAASHDLQEPLRGVTGCIQLLRRRYAGQLDTRADEFICHAVSNVERMQALILGLLDYARLDRAGEDFGPVDCADLFQSACQNLSSAIEESGAQVTSAALPVVSGDRTHLGQLFQNLLSNAIKFRGDDLPRVHVSAERLSDGAEERRAAAWKFSFRDNGIGVDPRHAQKIFGIFQRLHSRDKYSGTGIGLALCKRVVERHGGRIWVESELGRGATFHFTLTNSR